MINTEKTATVLATSFLISMVILCRDFFYYFFFGMKACVDALFLRKGSLNITDDSFFQLLGTIFGFISVPIILLACTLISLFVIFDGKKQNG